METNKDIREYNVGNSDYSKHKIQPWDIWREYDLNPWDADIVKRILRTKEEPGKSKEDSRIMDYEKIIHICKERIRQIEEDKKAVTKTAQCNVCNEKEDITDYSGW